MKKEEVIVLYPAPGMGHLVPMVELAKHLLLHHHHHTTTTTTTTNYFSIILLLTASPNNAPAADTSYIQQISLTNPSITLRHFPLLASSTSTSTSTAPRSAVAIKFEFIRLNATNVLHALQDISTTCIIRALVIDLFCTSALPIARDLRIPVYYFFTSGAAVLGCFLYLHTVHKQTKKSFKDLNTTYLLHFPGLPPIPAPHVPEPVLDRDDPAYAEFIQFCENLPNSDGIIVNTFDDLEPDSLKTISTGVCLPDAIIPPVYYIGPLIATTRDDQEVVCVGEEARRDSLMSWLDSQPGRSVVYLCFGSSSRGSFSAVQLKEIANGLESSGQRFLWVVKSQQDALLLPGGFLERTKGRGMVVTSWVPQVQVLRHESVGGFVTHCGWNSVLEAVVAGVPMVAWPLYAEQHVNKAILVENMKMAIPLEKREGDNGHLVSAAELAKRVMELMDLEVGRELRERSWKMREMALAAWGEAGSSTTALAELIGLF